MTDGKPHPGEQFRDPITDAVSSLISSTPAGSRLPAERDMAEQLGVSRTALRDRLQLLEALGVVRRHQGAGTFVEPLNPSGLVLALDVMLGSAHITTTDLHEVRVALERQAAMIIAARNDPSDIEALRSAITQMQDSSVDDDGVMDADLSFHRTLIDRAGNAALGFFVEALHSSLYRAHVVGTQRWKERRLSTNLLIALHDDVVDAIETGDPAEVSRAVDAHFVVVNRLMWDSDAPPAD